MHTEKVFWGGLTTLIKHDLAPGEQPAFAVVLCHGYGASGSDLADLAQPLLTSAAAKGNSGVAIFPQAPLDLTPMGMPGGWAWWPVDLDRLINRRTPELLDQFRRACPDGLVLAREKLLALLTDAGRHFGLSADRFFLGGFSQGAMLATDVALRLKKAPAGLCILSGALINEEEWRRLASERGPLAILQTHGLNDSILPYAMGTTLRDLLQGAGLDLEFLTFKGDHEIPLEALHRLTHFIRTHVGVSPSHQ
jgi:phospholipase/carboxylesterase